MAPLQPGTNRSLLWTTASALQTWSWLLQTLPSQPDQMHLKAEAGGSLEFIIPEPSHSPAPQHQGQDATSHLSHLVDDFGFYKCCFYLLIKRDFLLSQAAKSNDFLVHVSWIKIWFRTDLVSCFLEILGATEELNITAPHVEVSVSLIQKGISWFKRGKIPIIWEIVEVCGYSKGKQRLWRQIWTCLFLSMTKDTGSRAVLQVLSFYHVGE